MKTTLKTFPVVYYTKENIEVLNWLEAFEKELREKLAENWKPYSINDLLKEILGDSEE